MKPENIKSIIPLYLATVGLLVAIATLFSPMEDKTAGFGVAMAAITGAAGLAEPIRRE